MQKQRKYKTGLNGKDLVGKRILTEYYDSYFKKYSPEGWEVMDSDSEGKRVLIKPETGATYMNWREIEQLNIVDVLEPNKEVKQILADFREIEKNKPRFGF